MDSSGAGAGAATEVQFPEDIWFEIMSKAAAEEVAKYRRLSKFHRDLIDSPDFRRKHNDLSIKTRHHHVILSSSNNVDHRVDFTASNPKPRRLIPPKKFCYSCTIPTQLLDSCMGILCYGIPSLNCLLLWNLLTGCARKISLKGNNMSSWINFSYVLGHDDLSDDWKVLKMHRFTSNFEIYSSKTDSWKEHSAEKSVQKFISGRFPIFVEGTSSMHWICGNLIVAYNLSTQIFNKYFLPPNVFEPENPSSCFPMVSSLGGCLSFSVSLYTKNCLDVWTMKNYGVEESWTRLFSITTSLFSIRYLMNSLKPRPVVFLNNGSQLVLSDSRDRIYQYDVETSEMQTANLPKIARDLGSIDPRVFIFTPTLWKL